MQILQSQSSDIPSILFQKLLKDLGIERIPEEGLSILDILGKLLEGLIKRHEYREITTSKEDLEYKDQRIWKKERNAFAMMKNVLLVEEKYKGKFVAIHDEKIVDYDVDDRKLAKRVYEKYGYRPIYFGRVTEEIKVIEVPSPEYG